MTGAGAAGCETIFSEMGVGFCLHCGPVCLPGRWVTRPEAVNVSRRQPGGLVVRREPVSVWEALSNKAKVVS